MVAKLPFGFALSRHRRCFPIMHTAAEADPDVKVGDWGPIRDLGFSELLPDAHSQGSRIPFQGGKKVSTC